MQVAVKCRHCNELLHPELRRAAQPHQQQAPVVNVYNQSYSESNSGAVAESKSKAEAKAKAAAGPLQSLMGCGSLVLLTFVALALWGAFSGKSEKQDQPGQVKPSAKPSEQKSTQAPPAKVPEQPRPSSIELPKDPPPISKDLAEPKDKVAADKGASESAAKAKAEKEKAENAAAVATEASRRLNIARDQLASAKETLDKKGRGKEGLKLIEFAVKRLQAIVADFPGSPAASEAQELILQHGDSWTTGSNFASKISSLRTWLLACLIVREADDVGAPLGPPPETHSDRPLALPPDTCSSPVVRMLDKMLPWPETRTITTCRSTISGSSMAARNSFRSS